MGNKVGGAKGERTMIPNDSQLGQQYERRATARLCQKCVR